MNNGTVRKQGNKMSIKKFMKKWMTLKISNDLKLKGRLTTEITKPSSISAKKNTEVIIKTVDTDL